MHISLVNNGNDVQVVSAGEKIVQGVILKMNYMVPEEVENAEVLFKGSSSERGEGGFGSTDKQAS